MCYSLRVGKVMFVLKTSSNLHSLCSVIWDFDILYYFPLICFATSHLINYLLHSNTNLKKLCAVLKPILNILFNLAELKRCARIHLSSLVTIPWQWRTISRIWSLVRATGSSSQPSQELERRAKKLLTSQALDLLVKSDLHMRWFVHRLLRGHACYSSMTYNL